MRHAASIAIEGGYRGPLYAEISPKTFPVLVREGSRLSQIRFRHGDAVLGGEALRALHARERLVDRTEAVMGEGVAVSVDLSGSETANGAGIVGYRAKRHTAVIEVERRAAYEVADFWEPIPARADRSLILDPDEFYILASTEAVQVPPDYAAEMVPFDPLVGEFRVHYAGFFDPGFGYAGAGGLGLARRAGSALARSAFHPRARADRRTPGIRKDAGRCRTSSTAAASVRTTRRRA